MKANTKKLLAMGLSVVLAVGCLTGCGGDSKSSSTSGDTAKTGDEGGSSSSKKTFDDLGGMSIKIGGIHLKMQEKQIMLKQPKITERKSWRSTTSRLIVKVLTPTLTSGRHT